MEYSRRAIIASALGLPFTAALPERRAGATLQGGTDGGRGTGMFRGNLQRTGEFPGPGPKGTPRMLWGFQPGSGEFISSPALVGGVVYVGSTDGNVYAVDADNGEMVWQAGTGGPVISSPAVSGNVLYVGSYGALFALDTQTGAAAFQLPIAGAGQQQQRLLVQAAVDSSPAITNGIAYVGSSDGNLYAFEVETGARRAFPTGSPVLSSPALHAEVVYVGGYGLIYALRARELTEIRRFPVDGPVDTSIVVLNDKVYVATSLGGVYAFDTVTPDAEPGSVDPIWRIQLDGQIFSSPAVTTVDGTSYVFVACGDGNLYAFDAESGQDAWRKPNIPVYGPIASSPAVVPSDGVLYVGSGDGMVHAIDLRTHDERDGWPLRVGSRVDSSPVVLNGRVYVGSDGGLIAIGSA